MKDNFTETLIGALVLIIAGTFTFFAYQWGDVKPVSNGYTVKAKFERVDGITLGSDVSIAGVKVGTVTKQTLDVKSYLAVVEMSINGEIKIPKDSSAQIASSGLIGGKYIDITPGSAPQLLKSGETIEYTQSSVNLETLIGKMIFNSNDSNKK
ncbi:putative phospholipid ABC transporter-binding protein mlaD [Rickettsiales bacterium Ac37b]|nr:putative phospholipid ABC transporter-binding protein mlaD [Rickettsiales bacterium Ac37b]